MAKSLKDIYVGVKKNDANRKDHDFYPTPPLATFALVKYGNVPERILEPCAGKGNISVELMRNGHAVVSKDLIEHKDPLVDISTGCDALSYVDKSVDGVVTNPPYFNNLPALIAEHSINNYNYAALLVRLTFLEGKKRHELFKKHPPSKLIIFSDRVRFGDFDTEPVEAADQLGGMICYCWVVWDKRETKTSIKWVRLTDLYDEWRQNYDSSDLKFY